MFERYLTDALATHFGHLVEDVDAERVRLSAWNGELVLDDVRLRKDALDAFLPNGGASSSSSSRPSCPVEIVHGTVGTFHVKVPWSAVGAQLWRGGGGSGSGSGSGSGAPLSDAGCSIVLTDVNILITPRRKVVEDAGKVGDDGDHGDGEGHAQREDAKEDDDVGEGKEEYKGADGHRRRRRRILGGADAGAAQARRERRVQALLDANLLRRVTESSVAAAAAAAVASSSSRGGGSSSPSWLKDWLSGMLTNLSVTVRNVHIRYEDPGSSMGFEWRIASVPMERQPRYRPPFAVGITLREFSVRTVAESAAAPSAVIRGTPLASTASSATEVASSSSSASQTPTPTPPSALPLSSDPPATTAPSMAEDGNANVGGVGVPAPDVITEASQSTSRRHKVAAAEDLAIYWDGDAALLSLLALRGGDEVTAIPIAAGEGAPPPPPPTAAGTTAATPTTTTATTSTKPTAATSTTTPTTTTAASKQDLFRFYQSSFQQLNDGRGPRGRPHDATSKPRLPPPEADKTAPGVSHRTTPSRDQHSYLLDPISPSVHVTLVSRAPAAATAAAAAAAPPPSSLHVDLPPCKFTLSRATLEDLVYLRKSLSVWRHATRAVLSEPTLRRLAGMRPVRSPLLDPGPWWRYAVEATRVLTSVDRRGRDGDSGDDDESGDEDESDHDDQRPHQASWKAPSSAATSCDKEGTSSSRHSDAGQEDGDRCSGNISNRSSRRSLKKRRRGWIGLVQAVTRRRQYVELNREFLSAAAAGDTAAEEEAHRALLEMEDGLLPAEIVSFRIHVYEQSPLSSAGRHDDGAAAGSPPSSHPAAVEDGTLQDDPGRTKEASGMKHPEQALAKGESDEEILSIGHRLWMMHEMKEALDRERANRESRVNDALTRKSASDLMPHSPNEEEGSNPAVWTASLVCREFSIQINDQVGHYGYRGPSGGRSTTPVIRISTVLVQDQSWYEDGSWNVDCSLASLEVKDLISARGKPAGSRYFSTLLGRKTGGASGDDGEYLVINGIRYPRNISVTVHKRLHWNESGAPLLDTAMGRGSTTTTKIRVLPMEVVYSTLPVEAVSRVFSTVQTPEIVDDYHKVLAAANAWRDEQKKKLMEALAHKDKKIIVDIDIWAPELLLPEDIHRSDSPMLAFNLGRFQAFSDDKISTCNNLGLFDDQWRVILSSVQVRSTRVGYYFARSGREVHRRRNAPEQLVEAFSIDFVVSTKIAKQDSSDKADISRINISGTLPRLAFNFTSSALRLATRLQRKWELRKREMQFHSEVFQTPGSLINYQDISSMQRGQPKLEPMTVLKRSNSPNLDNRSARIFTFEFSAPLITLKLENDVDGRNCHCRAGGIPINGFDDVSTPLVDLALRGIRGSLVQELARNGDSATKFEAKLQSLGAIDLFQTAGNDFVLLMSSVPQIMLVDQISQANSYSWDATHAHYDVDDVASTRKDLVAIEYSGSYSNSSGNEATPEKIAIWFHELYVEWNPETLAAIQQAIGTPALNEGLPTSASLSSQLLVQSLDGDELSTDEEFYDALEDDFQDADTEGESLQPLSEISSSTDSVTAVEAAFINFDSSVEMRSSINSLTPNRPVASGIFVNKLFPSSPVSPNSPFGTPHSQSERLSSWIVPTLEPQSKRDGMVSKKREIVFELSKLRISFNKETRHRKVIVAQMDSTSVSYSTIASGGSRTAITIGNLIFIDPSFEDKDTLYGQILGLKTGTSDDIPRTPSSLLEMEIVLNQKSREFSSTVSDDISNTVTIDRDQGKMAGSDSCVNARFSPMRFVLIEQLWFEVMDYFFQGIIGNKVWGSQKVESSGGGQSNKPEFLFRGTGFLPGADANGITFTRFDVTLDSPAILLPVTYSSPEFVRLELSRIHLSNEYNGTIVSDTNADKEGSATDRMQWFNNCKVALDDLRLFSWSGRELGKKPAIGSILLRWPTGPSAQSIFPKWRVECNFDSLDVSLRRSDYALLQNIITYNVGEPSRYMNEWEALQSLSVDVLETFLKGIIVHYGYDKKDSAPTTYDVKVTIPSLTFGLLADDKENSKAVAVARCFDLQWRMQKESDLVVKQKVMCDIDLVVPKGDSDYDKLMSMSKYDREFDPEKDADEIDMPSLTYTSTTMINRDNVKKLEITGACIYMVVPAWKRFSSFFQSLTPPILLNRNDIGASIQVGDRWYRIGGKGGLGERDDVIAPAYSRKSTRSFSWMSMAHKPPAPQLKAKHKSPPNANASTYQFQLLLLWPRIVLSSVPVEGPPTRVILRMHHLDFLQTKSGDASTTARYTFVHDVEVYTSSQKKPAQSSEGDEQNSLIHPWSFCGSFTRCNGESAGKYDKLTHTLSSDVLRARAAYSDMAIAIDVILSVLHSAKEESIEPNDGLQQPIFSGSFDSGDSLLSQSAAKEVTHENEQVTCPSLVVYSILCDGFELKVADDSGRHFSGTQDLVILSLGKTLFSREEAGDGTSRMNFWLGSLDLYDCLQPPQSPFRNAASSHSMAINLRGSTEIICRVDNTINDGLSAGKMPWRTFSTKQNVDMLFVGSSELLARLDDATTECTYVFAGSSGPKITPMTGLIEISCTSTEGSNQDYDIRLRSFAVQWNPSTVIAIQRFLGRLRKESEIIAVQVFHQQFDDLIGASRSDDMDEISTVESIDGQKDSLTRVNIQIDSLTVCLNKEHQNRRLLELNLSSCKVEMSSSGQGMSVEGRIGDLSAFDSDMLGRSAVTQAHITDENRYVLKVLPSREAGSPDEFLHVRYNTFTKQASGTEKTRVPDWVQTHLHSPDDIDDFLILTIASTRFTYLKERTEEIMDYLSNGLPGKGMGATSRAAKGFISRRIQTKSFLQLRVDSPQIFVPQHELSVEGLALKLGDVNIYSWFEESLPGVEHTVVVEWWRILSLRLSGFCSGVLRQGLDFNALSSATNPIDLDILLKKPTVKGRKLSIKGKLTFLEVSLCYCDYALLRAVARDNISRRIDTDKWDNVEKAYWMEEAQTESFKNRNDSDFDQFGSNPSAQNVAYSSNARFVRYGKGGKKGTKLHQKDLPDPFPSQQENDTSSNILDIRFDLDGLSLKLTRDDLVEGVLDGEELAAAFHYDISLLKVDIVEVICTANSAGDVSFNLSLFRIGLFDLGDNGRLVRERFYDSLRAGDVSLGKGNLRGTRQPCPFYVLAEGYKSSRDDGLVESSAEGPQFVVTVDTCPASSTTGFGLLSDCGLPADTKVTVARIVINYLSLNALIRPFREIVGFLSCEWPSQRGHAPKSVSNKPRKDETKYTASTETSKDVDVSMTSSRGVQIKLVAHYPRVFFLADESDAHSRALVLRGLAVVNVSDVKRIEPTILDSVDVQHITSLDAQLHGLETYINPDVDEALRFSRRHVEMIGKNHSSSFPIVPIDQPLPVDDLLGVALIQPVTAGIEYTQVERDLFPTKRALFVNIEAVSTMLSFEDLQLVEAVMNRWSAKKIDKATRPTADVVDTSAAPSEFQRDIEDRIQLVSTHHEVVFHSIRLGLGLKSDQNRVVVNSVQSPEYRRQIEPGDFLLSVGDEDVTELPLDEVVQILSKSKRPVTVKFQREIETVIQGPNVLSSADTGRSKACGTKKFSSGQSFDDSVSGYSIPCYTVRFHTGMSLGLEFERSPCGQFPVVSRILTTIHDTVVWSSTVDESNANQIEVIESAFDTDGTRLPRVGAIIVAIDDFPIDELGVDQAWLLLAKMQQRIGTDDPSENQITRNATFRVLFQEIDSSIWGKIESVDVATSGIALSFIDDLNGRDMPLFRGKLSAIELHVERGIGIEAHILDGAVPSILTPLVEDLTEGDSIVVLTPDEVEDLKSECIISFSAVGRCAIDYFHPRVSFWEPFLEPSQLFFLFEKQEASERSNRPAQLALELSDRLLRNQFARGNYASCNYAGESQMVSVNLTDAAAEVFVEAFSQWKEWRKGLAVEADEIEFEDITSEEMVKVELLPALATDSSGFTDSVSTPRIPDALETFQQAQRAAAKKAAHAALVFAKKRGAETSKKQDTAKSAVLRNRTGVSIAFVQQGRGLRANNYSWGPRRTSENLCTLSAAIGEYNGLDGYEQQAITELADHDDAKFDIDLVDEGLDDDASVQRSARHFTNKVRSYEGRYPHLTVAIQAVAGVLVDPIVDLQVFKVGTTIRHLVVRKDYGTDNDSDSTIYSIGLVWKVEIENNRRILTLSTAVRVVTSGFSMSVEVGYRRDSDDSSSQLTTTLGVARSENAFYLPLWLALKLEPVSIYVRPSSTIGAEYNWSESKVLHFGRAEEDLEGMSGLERNSAGSFERGRWTWEETFPDLSSIRCSSRVQNTMNYVWFSVYGSSSPFRQPKAVKGHSLNKRREYTEEHTHVHQLEVDEVLSVTLDSGLTIRNLLPLSIEWEVAQVTGALSHSNKIDTHLGFGAEDIGPIIAVEGRDYQFSQHSTLRSGECVEVIGCNYNSTSLQARFKQFGGNSWSTWACLALEETSEIDEDYELMDPDGALAAMFPTPSQVNVLIREDDLGTPLVFGVRIVPKMTSDDPYYGRVYGLEVIIYAELWIRNITSLPLNFGCPTYQLHEPGSKVGRTRTASDESVARFTAESALMEIANLLEVGDKGTGLNQSMARQISETGVLESLPDQECSLLVEEVFEYVEIESSMVKRRWWASESYDAYRGRIVDVADEKTNWKWVDEKWAIDCAGGAKPSFEGWESCRNMLAGAGSFSSTREFNPCHAFRRRRFFRSRNNDVHANFIANAPGTQNNNMHERHMGGIQVFHQPIKDSFSREQKNLKRKQRKGVSKDHDKDQGDDDIQMKIAIKCGDGKWSLPTSIPDAGTCFGVFQVLSSRWPELTKMHGKNSETATKGTLRIQTSPLRRQLPDQDFVFKSGCLGTDVHELCYSVSDVAGEWGEFSRCMEVSPRFLIRNDSTKQPIKVKQTGAPESTSLTLQPGEASPFYWADFRLPKLASVLPLDESDTYKWSGGFDLCNLGMTPVRIRNERIGEELSGNMIMSIRALVEVRPRSGGFGVNVSFREEEPNGDGSLFRIENLTAFPIWFAQDGVLANPNTLIRDRRARAGREGDNSQSDDAARIDGDLLPPYGRSTFALDVPYMQGKYAHRNEATMSELLHVRVAVAPLSSRAGIETVKVIGLTTVGDTIRLNPSKLPLTLSEEGNEKFQMIRILGVVATDGPTRVLRFCLMAHPDSDAAIRSSIAEVSYVSSSQSRPQEPVIDSSFADYSADATRAATTTLAKLRSEKIPNELDAKRQALFANLRYNAEAGGDVDEDRALDKIYSFRAEFSGFIFSLIDCAPSEIAVVSLRNVNALARWNSLRTTDASLILSIGWLQIDNHVPSAPFKVAVRPDTSTKQALEEEVGIDPSPLLVVALAFAPKHKSEILVLRSVTVAPRNLVIAIDLAFLVRLQRFFMGIQDHVQKDRYDAHLGLRSGPSGVFNEQKKTIPFPAFDSPQRQLEKEAAFSENKKMYFQGLTILPTNVKLSVAPARALTSEQAALEGREAAAIHEAVRKGDVLVGSSSGPLGVRVGRKNKTPLAVVRGIFKSFVVDALLRLDGASLNFPGVFLRNHIATGSQLTTFLVAHYVTSLKNNVPALLGSLAAIGNPLGLIRGIGDGVSDFVSEPIKGFKRSLKELDPGYVVDGVARGTESLARHTVGGLADSASLLTETFSKYMAVVTLDRRYAQKRDRGRSLRLKSDSRVTLASGVESGFLKLVQGFREGVTGVVKAPLRGAEKRGFQGFAKGLGKGLLGLLVKPIIGISDAATDLMIGVKSTVEYKEEYQQNLALLRNQLRPRRPMYGRDKVLRPYKLEDAAAATIMLRTRCAGENYLGHLDMGDRVALLSVRRLIILGPRGDEQLALKYGHVDRVEARSIKQEDGTDGWGIVIVLNTPRRNGSEVEVITCQSQEEAIELCSYIQRGLNLTSSESMHA